MTHLKDYLKETVGLLGFSFGEPVLNWPGEVHIYEYPCFSLILRVSLQILE